MKLSIDELVDRKYENNEQRVARWIRELITEAVDSISENDLQHLRPKIEDKTDKKD